MSNPIHHVNVLNLNVLSKINHPNPIQNKNKKTKEMRREILRFSRFKRRGS